MLDAWGARCSFQKSGEAFGSFLGPVLSIHHSVVRRMGFPKHFYQLWHRYSLRTVDFSWVDGIMEIIKSELFAFTIELSEAQGDEMSHSYCWAKTRKTSKCQVLKVNVPGYAMTTCFCRHWGMVRLKKHGRGRTGHYWRVMSQREVSGDILNKQSMCSHLQRECQ